MLQLGHFKDEEIILIPSISFMLHTGYLGVVINPHLSLFSCNCVGMEGERPARLNRAEADRDTYRRSAAPRKYTDESGF